MFCFNVKNKRYAIGNVEVGRERFMETKRMLLAKIAGELTVKKEIAGDIYNIGCKQNIGGVHAKKQQ